MKKISYLIPTNRKFEDFIYKTIDSIVPNSKDFDYEIIVFSKERIERENVIWVEEKGSKGPIYGFNKMVEVSTGEYIVCLVDDHILVNSISPTIDLLDDMKTTGKPVICSLGSGAPCFNPIYGEILGDRKIDKHIQKYPLVRFPVVHKKTLELLDNLIFHPDLYYHAGDIWMGFYIGHKFGSVQDGHTQITVHNPQKDSSWEVKDCNVVRELIYELLVDENMKYSKRLMS